MSENKKFVIRCRAIILYKGRLLVVRHVHDTSFAALPGGHLEWGEDVRECLSRELVEELGVKPDIGRLLYINTFLDGGHIQPVEFFFEVLNGKEYVDSENMSRSHAHELSEICWVRSTDNIKILPQKCAEDFRDGKLLADEPRYIKG